MIRPQMCPICRKDVRDPNAKHFPFCSERCRQVDLLRWSKGEYAIVSDLDPREAALLKAIEDGDLPPELLD